MPIEEKQCPSGREGKNRQVDYPQGEVLRLEDAEEVTKSKNNSTAYVKRNAGRGKAVRALGRSAQGIIWRLSGGGHS